MKAKASRLARSSNKVFCAHVQYKTGKKGRKPVKESLGRADDERI